MRKIWLIAMSLLALSLSAARELTIGEYSQEVRDRVVAKLREALAVEGAVAEVGGVVTYSGNGCFFLQRDRDGMKVIVKSDAVPLPSPGVEVVASGAPSLEGGHVVFAASAWKHVAVGTLPEVKAVSIRDLVTGGANAGNWLRVKVKGRALGLTETGLALEDEGFPVNVVIDEVPAELKDLDETHPILEVTGVADLILDQSALLDDEVSVMGVKLNVSSASDIVIKPDAIYWARQRHRQLTALGIALIAVLVVVVLAFAVVVFRQQRRLFRSRTIMAERKRMADDIHDTIEQHLVGAGMLLKLNRSHEAQEVLVRAKREIRDIVWGLKNDDMMRLTPAEMLRKLAHEENVKGICRVDTRLEGLPPKLDAAAMRDLSLIVREAIGNAVKHGAARHVAISADPLDNGGWRLRIANDGALFDPAAAPDVKAGHFGLEGMRQRACRLGAEFSIGERKRRMVVTLEKRI